MADPVKYEIYLKLLGRAETSRQLEAIILRIKKNLKLETESKLKLLALAKENKRYLKIRNPALQAIDISLGNNLLPEIRRVIKIIKSAVSPDDRVSAKYVVEDSKLPSRIKVKFLAILKS